MGKYLLREFFQLCEGGVCTDLLTEEEKREVRDNDAVFLTGVAQRADAKNGNQRIYPYDILMREVKNYERAVQERRSVGNLDHPDSEVVSLKDASHLVTKIWMEGKDVMVKLKVLSGVPGQQVRSLIRDGVALGLSSRALGSVTETAQGLIVEDDLMLICFDLVTEPSTQGAFMTLTEAKNYNVGTRSDRLHRAMKDILGQ